MPLFLKLLRLFFIGFLGASVVAATLALGAYIYFAPGLPSVETLKDIELQVPLRVYSRDEKLIAVYGEKRRTPLKIDQIPDTVKIAFLAAEDDRFFDHPGVDYQGLIRAAIDVAVTGQKRQGGSTITMQLARNFFLGRERTYVRKLREIFLALRIEKELSKNEILELYLNKIYLGNRAYGVAAAASVYYGLPIHELDIAQVAMIAGLPKAPSRFNPIANPQRARIRRNYVLTRMRDLKYIDKDQYALYSEAPITASRHYPKVEAYAPYIGEMARAKMVEEQGIEVYNMGLRVYTTIDSHAQEAANRALVKGLIAYDHRHGFRGAESKVELSSIDIQPILDSENSVDTNIEVFAKMDNLLSDYPQVAGLSPAIVLLVEMEELKVYLGSQQIVSIMLENSIWARPYLNENSIGKEPSDFTRLFKPGDVIRTSLNENEEWELNQIPSVSGAIVALDPNNGGIMALAGGLDFNYSKFNRVIQARRQPGSSFKPFIYSAALDSGYTPASVVNDAPVVFEDAALEDTWRPQNYSGKFFGPTRLRDALTKSRNMVSIRLLKDIGRRTALDHIVKFGFDREKLPYDLTLALGSGAVTPLELASAYAVFANGGYLVKPHLIERIDDVNGHTLFRSNPNMVCEQDCQLLQQLMNEDEDELDIDVESETPQIQPAPRVIPQENAYQMVSMMQDVIRRGTGRRALVLERNDIAGKTGTTNDQHDAWFSGFNGDVVATAWVGFDQHKPLGRREVGGIAALPIWIDFMRDALKGRPENSLAMPEGMVTLKIDPATGFLVAQDSEFGIEETFRQEYIPTQILEIDEAVEFPSSGSEIMEIPEQLF